MYRKSGDASEKRTEAEPSERVQQTLKLTDQYIALLVLVFTNAGLLDVSLYILRDVLSLTTDLEKGSDLHVGRDDNGV